MVQRAQASVLWASGGHCQDTPCWHSKPIKTFWEGPALPAVQLDRTVVTPREEQVGSLPLHCPALSSSGACVRLRGPRPGQPHHQENATGQEFAQSTRAGRGCQGPTPRPESHFGVSFSCVGATVRILSSRQVGFFCSPWRTIGLAEEQCPLLALQGPCPMLTRHALCGRMP